MTARAMINSFVIGMGSAFDLSGGYYRSSQPFPKKRNISDVDAIRSDWEMVGKDINKAIESLKVSNEQ